MLKKIPYQVLSAQDWLFLYDFVNEARKRERFVPLTSKEMVDHLIYVTENYEISFLRTHIQNYKEKGRFFLK